jgi:aspartyl protease family protein
MLLAGGAHAVDLTLAGLLGGKAVLIVDDGPPRTVAVGKSTPEGVRLLAISGDTATVGFGGRRYGLRLGGRLARPKAGEGGARGNAMSSEQARKILARGVEVVIEANAQGQFVVDGEIENRRVRFLVDTGASVVSLGRSEAWRLGIDFEGAPQGRAHTAAGEARLWNVTLKMLKVGGIRFEDVEAVVMEADMPQILLGMNVLEQMEMRRDGAQMRLRKKL